MKTINITSEMINRSADIQQILDENRGTDVEIVFQEGQYYLDAGLRLGKEHTGMTLRGEGKARLIGGKCLKGWTVAEDAHISPEARGCVFVCDLRENGIDDTGEMVSRGFARPVGSAHSQLFINGEPMQLTRYPKGDASLTISGVVETDVDVWNAEVGKLEAGFYYNDERPAGWSNSGDIWVHGYWSYDWAGSYERIAMLDTVQKKIVNAPPFGNYSFRKGQRFFFLNILEELTQPGEYYIDRKQNMLYFIPPTGEADMEVLLSLLDEPLLTVKDSADITVSNLWAERTRGNGILVEHCTGVTIDNCHICDIGNHGVVLRGGKNNQVIHSTIHDCGDCGVEAVGGDRQTLEAADFLICNNHIYRASQWSRCYQPPILMTGVGMTAKNNLIHDCPHIGILYWGNDMIIEDNEIYRVVMETGDAGAIYTGKDFTYRGNRVCHNYIHHVGGVGMGAMGIYNDDCVSGTEMEDNYFVETKRAVMLGGGRDFVVKNNVFVNCNPGIEVDSRGAYDHPVWQNMVTNILKERFYHIQNVTTANVRVSSEKDISGMDSIYLSRYPELQEIDAYYQKGDVIPGSAVIQGNVYFPQHHKWNAYHISGMCGTYLYEGNVFAAEEDFRDAAWSDWELREESKVFKRGYEGRSMAGIGLQRELRKENPCNVMTALGVEKREAGAVICLHVWNREDNIVCGTVSVKTEGTECSLTQAVEFDLGPLERKEYFLELADTQEELTLEASSPIPGVRPSIYRVTDDQ